MDILLAYNPKAGNFRPQLLDQLSSALASKGHNIQSCESHSAELKQIAVGCQHICVIGGDGTLRDVIAAVGPEHPSVIFSQYPLGTINLVAREAGYCKDISRLAEKIHAGKPGRTHYSASFNRKQFLACASVGPDAWSVSRVSLNLKKRIGRLAYGTAFLVQFAKWKQQKLSISADGHAYDAEAAYILKGRFFAGPWILSDTADLGSDKLSVLLLPKAGRADFLRLMSSVLISPRLASRAWHRIECEEIYITSQEQAPVQADGDIVGHLPIRFSMNPQQLLFA